jgi:L-asparaginase
LSAQQLSKVALFTLGGTIAATPTGDGRVSPGIDGTALVAAVPQLAAVARIDVTEFRRIPSGDLSLVDVLELARDISGREGDRCDGVVVTQGTDTLEETAFALDQLLAIGRPVVVTGAMRNPTMAGADGPANLLAAVQVAASSDAAGRGVLVVMNDEIHAARWVRKSHSFSTAAFTSPNAGPIGVLLEGRARFFAPPYTKPAALTRPVSTVPAVALVRIVLGDDDRLLREVEALGYAGLVVEGFGAGHVPSRMVDALTRLAQTMPVVLTSRTGEGMVLTSTYGFAGSESDLLARGLISAGALDGLKSRVLLSLLLGAGYDFGAVRKSFHSYCE